MPRRPREKYFQLAGRPHVGMDDPERFGLTFNEVVRLIDGGRWKTFYKTFIRREKKEALIGAIKYTCPICKESIPDIDKWKNDGTSCLGCVNFKSKLNGAAYQAKGRRGKNAIETEKFYCSVCCNYRISVVGVGETVICQGCLERL